jgi:hypothetical protein
LFFSTKYFLENNRILVIKGNIMETSAASNTASLAETQAKFDESLQFSADMQTMAVQHNRDAAMQDIQFQTEQSETTRMQSVAKSVADNTDTISQGIR